MTFEGFAPSSCRKSHTLSFMRAYKHSVFVDNRLCRKGQGVARLS